MNNQFNKVHWLLVNIHPPSITHSHKTHVHVNGPNACVKHSICRAHGKTLEYYCSIEICVHILLCKHVMYSVM